MISDVKTKHTHIPVRVHGISDGEYEFRYEVQPAEIGLPDQFTKPVHVQVVMEKSGEEAFLRVTTETVGAFPCDRCLEELTVPVQTAFSMLYVREDETAQISAADEDPRSVNPADPVIDITPEVVDFVLVGVPMRKVCEDYNPGNTACLELVRAHDHDEEGGNTTDPRWSALKNLKLDE